MENRENLSKKEQNFLGKKSRGRRIFTFFFPIIAFIYLRRNDGYLRTCVIILLIAALFSSMGQKVSGAEAGIFLSIILVILAKIIAICDFTEMTYKSNPFLFKEYLDEYHNYHNVKYSDDGYDEFGFNKKGIHKDTGTEYDKHGFNRDARVILKNAGRKPDK